MASGSSDDRSLARYGLSGKSVHVTGNASWKVNDGARIDRFVPAENRLMVGVIEKAPRLC